MYLSFNSMAKLILLLFDDDSPLKCPVIAEVTFDIHV